VRSLQEISKNLSENLKIENLFLVRNAESRYPPRNILTLPHDEVFGQLWKSAEKYLFRILYCVAKKCESGRIKV
jgi:hypothetical protein